jgi:hypothetical protein
MRRDEAHAAAHYRGAGMMHKRRNIMRKPSSFIHRNARRREIHYTPIAR